MRLLPAFIAASLLASPALQAAQTCTRPSDRAAFEIEGLKSELMVTSLKCNLSSRYNDFMGRYRPDVAAQEKMLAAYFKRAYGRGGQKAYDDYISNLANAQSEDSLSAGTVFCDNLPALFDEVMSLHSGAELDEFANTQDIVQPAAFETCTGVEPVAKVRRRSRRASH